MTSAAWWITYAILGLYALNAVWLFMLGLPWGTVYWGAAAVITVAAMQGITR